MQWIIHKSGTRGFASHGWLTTYHTFSFANYYNPERMHFGALRVINDDTIEAGMGFGMHPHDNMEIITIPLSGELQHKDSMGNTSVISAGEVQVMTAGTGVYHSEFNHSKTDDVSLLQIWVFPERSNLKPTYQQTLFNASDFKNNFKTIVSPDKIADSLHINQKAWFTIVYPDKDVVMNYKFHSAKSGVYCFIIDGKVTVEKLELDKRDGVGFWNTEKLQIQANTDAKILLMEVPM